MRKTTSMKLDPVVKQEAQEIFATLGLTLGEAVNLFLNQVRLRRCIPFDIEIPKSKTVGLTFESAIWATRSCLLGLGRMVGFLGDGNERAKMRLQIYRFDHDIRFHVSMGDGG